MPSLKATNLSPYTIEDQLLLDGSVLCVQDVPLDEVAATDDVDRATYVELPYVPHFQTAEAGRFVVLHEEPSVEYTAVVVVSARTINFPSPYMIPCQFALVPRDWSDQFVESVEIVPYCVLYADPRNIPFPYFMSVQFLVDAND